MVLVDVFEDVLLLLKRLYEAIFDHPSTPPSVRLFSGLSCRFVSGTLFASSFSVKSGYV